MTLLAQLDPQTATTNQLRMLLTEEEITTLELSRNIPGRHYTTLSTLLNLRQAIIPDLTADVLKAVTAIKAQRDGK